MSSSVRAAATAAGDSPVVETGARVGYASSGVLHLLIAWIALNVAWSSTSSEADQTGALEQLAGTTLGSALLWVAGIGFGLLGLWQLSEVVARHRTSDRVKAAAKAVVYLALAWTTISVLRGTESSGSGQTSSATATVLAQPLGRWLVMAGGAVIIGVGVYHVVKGWRRGFLTDLREHPGTWAVHAGRIGYIAKGVALGVLGGLFVAAGATADPQKARGLDGALRALLDLPAGQWLLTLVAMGFAAYGLYSFARARYARV
ncbi:MAG: DUF1206 domain-containing protein [Cellulomonadaceae bacterium]|nr:DUF1206 domain-containing protein [Cellulomonadaceae bacterium]